MTVCHLLGVLCTSFDGAACSGIANVVALHKEFVYSNALILHVSHDLAHFACPHNIVL